MGFIDDRAAAARRADFPAERLLGDWGMLERMVRAGEVDEVIIALPWSAVRRIREITARLEQWPVRVGLAAGPISLEESGRDVRLLAGVPVLPMLEASIPPNGALVKRALDIVVAALLLAALAPSLGAIALAIRLDSPGPVLFRQPRAGYNQQSFTMLKFRSMRLEADDPAGTHQTSADDPRVTRVGGWLRRTSFDELPQLWNVLRGDMSLVGPRPHAHGTLVEGRPMHEVADRYTARHRVKPGITGWAQVNGWRGETDAAKLEARIRHDLFYIEHWHLGLDLLILLRTLLVPLLRVNAY